MGRCFSLLTILVTLCWFLSGLYLTYCRLKTGHPAPDSDLEVLGREEWTLVLSAAQYVVSFYHCMGTLVPWFTVPPGAQIPFAELLPNQSVTDVHWCTLCSLPDAGLCVRLCSTSGGSWSTCWLIECMLAVFLAVLAQQAWYLWQHRPCTWQHVESGIWWERKKAFSLFLKAEINQAICSIKKVVQY